MIKTLAYLALAVTLGIAMTLLPTWLFLAETYKPSFSYAEKLSSGRIPLLTQEGVGEPIVPQWPEVVGAGLAVASVVYVWFKRRILNPRGQGSPRMF